ncbi:DUF2157 domain-containing protein [Nostoc sp. CENA67]|uniref:DUF2157 domain-containing protein n=1 Tax=Amazonocrinis nigriterrae CENA67 TaxID=2794033 RepID=A0A8J7HY04_9NOST|nr:DUF2157 domain-containing protein [Amazonocrinis nigriterrae]MBH8564509.1 DUF2157 domain-containing protein [Amazonocrinis nigriterrae CENA67]
MLLDNFRRKLRTEAQLWQSEGLIDADLYQRLAQRYEFDHLETAARDRFVFILIAVGAILLGLGVITFVAANWQALTREVKLILLLSLFLVTNITGFSLWKPATRNNQSSRDRKRRQRVLGEGLLIVGSLTIGANMALLAQMYHVNGSSYELFLGWGLAVLLMAYSLRLTSLGMLALILMLMGSWIGLFNWYYAVNELTWGVTVIEHLPLVLSLLFVPLAYWCRSRWIFRITAIAFVISWQSHLRSLEVITYTDTPLWLTIAAFTVPPALLWSYDDSLFRQVNSKRFQPFARSLTWAFFSITFYFLSFRWLWQARMIGYQTQFRNTPLATWLPFLDVAIFIILAVWQWWHLLRPTPNQQRQPIEVKSIFIGSLIVITALVIFVHQAITPIQVIPIFAFNLLLAVLAFKLIREALELGERRPFWGGIVLLTLQIISRMLEYDTALLFKSLIFVLCGVGVIIAGLWFERYLSSRPTISENNS